MTTDVMTTATPHTVAATLSRLDFVVYTDDRGQVPDGLLETVLGAGYSRIELNCSRVDLLGPLVDKCATRDIPLGAIATGRWLRCASDLADYQAYTRRAVAALVEGARIAAPIGSPLVIGLIRGARHVPKSCSREFLRRAVGEVCGAVPDARLLIEPITALEAAWPNSICDGLEVLHDIKQARVKLLADSYHIVRSGEVFDVIDHRHHIGHLHIRDNRKLVPENHAAAYGPMVYLWQRCGLSLSFELDAPLDMVPEQAGRGIEWIREAVREYSLSTAA